MTEKDESTDIRIHHVEAGWEAELDGMPMGPVCLTRHDVLDMARRIMLLKHVEHYTVDGMPKWLAE